MNGGFGFGDIRNGISGISGRISGLNPFGKKEQAEGEKQSGGSRRRKRAVSPRRRRSASPKRSVRRSTSPKRRRSPRSGRR